MLFIVLPSRDPSPSEQGLPVGVVCYKNPTPHVPAAAEAVLLHGDGFLGGKSLQEHFVADHFLVLDTQRAPFAERKLGRRGNPNRGKLPECGSAKCFRRSIVRLCNRVGEFDRDQPTANSNGRHERPNLRHTDAECSIQQPQRLPGQRQESGDLLSIGAKDEPAMLGQLQGPSAELPSPDRMDPKAVCLMCLGQHPGHRSVQKIAVVGPAVRAGTRLRTPDRLSFLIPPEMTTELVDRFRSDLVDPLARDPP